MKVAAVVALTAAVGVNALDIIRPNANFWWVAESQATIAWMGEGPTNFTTYVMNKDPNLLASGSIILDGITDSFNKARDLTLPPGINPGKGYYATLNDPFNSSNIYATSDEFEVKPKGSDYPQQNATGTGTQFQHATATGGSTSGTGAGSGTGAPASSSTEKKSGAATLGASVVAVAAAGALSYVLA